MTRPAAKTDSLRLGEDTPEPKEPGGPPPGLVVLFTPEGASLDRAYVMSEPILVIGRDTTSGVALAHDAAASGQHAMLRWDEGRLTVTDLDSRNGTWINGERAQETELAEGDVLRAGATSFKVVFREAAAYGDFLLDGTRRSDTTEEREARSRRGFAGGYHIEMLTEGLRLAARAGITIALRGETGTGKEVLARWAHAEGGRRGAFVAVNCGAIPPGLVESELFGVRKGAYSDATADRLGYVRQAQHGTLFLDEIGDMALEAQTRLLRVLQEREVQPLGGSQPEKVDIHVVCATHQDLSKLVERGRFRQDLLGRLLECSFEILPLRARREDIVPLCLGLLARHGRPDLSLSASFVDPLFRYDFPHNVRELEAIIKQAIAFAREDATTLTSANLPRSLRKARKAPEKVENAAQSGPAAPSLPPGKGQEIPPDMLRWMVQYHGGNLKATAAAFGIGRPLLYRLLAAHSIDVQKYR